MNVFNYLQESIEFDKLRIKHFQKIARIKCEGRLNCRYDKSRKRLNYYLKLDYDTKEHYVKQHSNALVWNLQSSRFAKEMIRILTNNIMVKEELMQQLESEDVKEVINLLPLAYRPNPIFMSEYRKAAVVQSENDFRPEERTVITSFGLATRSKSEAFIAEKLYSLGIEFYYEKRLELVVERIDDYGYTYETMKTYYPDFTIILASGMEFYIEHEGLLSNSNYIQKAIQKQFDYNANGIFAPYNLMVTMDGANNLFDFENVGRLIDVFIAPRCGVVEYL